MTEKEIYTKEADMWVDQKKHAVKLVSCIGELMYNKGVELVLFRNPLIETGVSEMLNLHNYASKIVQKPIDIESTAEIAEILTKMDLAPSKLDIGRLDWEWKAEKTKYENKEEFLLDKLSGFLGQQQSSNIQPQDVVLYGFGRIGRLCARELINMAGKGQQLRLRAIVVRRISAEELKKRADLFRMDSVHGPFKGVVEVDTDTNEMIINGQIIQIIAANDPSEIDYESRGIQNALVIDNTGVYRDFEALSKHKQAKGVSRVLLTAPGKGIPNVVYGVNHKDFDNDKIDIWSAASCTTNAIVPVLKIIDQEFGINSGHIETVHAYTNDQNLLDNMHSKHRRGRSAAVNMVITETGAAKAAVKVLPQLEGKLTANAVRVPTPNGSLAIMNLNLNTKTDLVEVNNLLKNAALHGDLVNQIRYSVEPEMVSNDIIGNTCCSVFDSPATIVSKDGRSVVLYVWYDNEFGYTKQVLRMAKYVSKVQRLIYY
ncbi:MAG: glyceraldehyde-3-phosphate dehydrogenase [Flavobacteriales bacterium]|nr:glyceraldehyde-3-phosphate dehydrogenase [Flavobacteriales bacterium]